ncbi:hypothetical protein CCY99_07530 [Helicobacter sp. 16-1353]|uniref:Abi family protein n=1 Tax=Helicobacter sp. 16-1353 TaxID=2004996 RepID=UPI000DCE1F3F|nr:Abi family protein [Helicobacter sp. 16-1353]RAX52234.1 hypothetical protein CCY99_07530 [Helicobacter sp. 16-1353]
MKHKLNTIEQVDYLQSLGVIFNIYDKEKAIAFLKNNNYFFKIKSYLKNYEKYPQGYKNIDFAHLVEFSLLDMYLRRIILEISLDIEHLLKANLNAHISENNEENGYDIVELFFNTHKSIKENINKRAITNSFVRNLVEKYQNNFASWNLMEILSFGDFLRFYKFYIDTYQVKNYQEFYSLAYSVRMLRNGAAHNNCMLNTIRIPYNKNFKPDKKIQRLVANIPSISKNTRVKILNNPFFHDCIALIWLFNRLCRSEKMINMKRSNIKWFFKQCIRHKEYFANNNFLYSRFLAIHKIIFYLFKHNIIKQQIAFHIDQKCH